MCEVAQRLANLDPDRGHISTDWIFRNGQKFYPDNNRTKQLARFKQDDRL